MSYTSFAALLNRLHRVRVLLVGDVMLDRFVYGDVERISPEAPIPVVHVNRVVDMPGGAANVARNCSALGAAVTLVGVVGNDADAQHLRNRLTAECGIRHQLLSDDGRPTTTKTRYVAARQQVMRADTESRAPLSAELEQRIVDFFQSELPSADIVLLSDYSKGLLSEPLSQRLISLARAADKPVLVDPKTVRMQKYFGATVLTPNRHELELACGHACSSDEEVVIAARQTLSASGCASMVVTRGADGMTVVEQDGRASHLHTMAREVFDVSGAGDTVLATLALAIASGAELVACATLANIAAGIVVSKQGTAVVSPGELLLELEKLDGHAVGKVLTVDGVADKVRAWKDRGQKVAFANGCFDLLHPGHITLLTKARAAADKLIVGLNSDASVSALKGPDRPVQSQAARAAVLASLECVDGIVIFGEATPIELIKAIEPDVLVKGSDYTIDGVVGADEVISRGGRVLLVDLVEGHSTTNTLRRVNTRANG